MKDITIEYFTSPVNGLRIQVVLWTGEDGNMYHQMYQPGAYFTKEVP